MKKLNGRLAVVEKDLKEVKKDLGEVKEKQTVNDKKVEAVEKDVEQLKKTVKGNTNNTKTSIMSEVTQREMRKTNIIVHGLEEPQVEGAANKQVFKEKEEEALNSLLDSMSLTEVKQGIKFKRRLGERKENKPRPLLIGFKNANERNLVMEASWKRSSSKFTTWLYV